MGTRRDATFFEARRAAVPARLRPRELQDWLNLHVYHPLAWRLALGLAPTRVTPNMISIAGGLIVVAAAGAYALPGWPWSALAGLTLHMGWHVLDGADGDLARISGRSGPHGELVDGICDYCGHVVLYLVLGTVLQAAIGWPAWPLAITAGISRIAQANHYESTRRQYQARMYGTPWLRDAGGGATLPGRLYVTLAGWLCPHRPAIDAALATRDGQGRDALRSAVRSAWDTLPRSLDLLRSNHRTLALGVSMLAESPLYYFVYETVGLNAVLARSIIAHGAAERMLAARFGGTTTTAAIPGESAAWTR